MTSRLDAAHSIRRRLLGLLATGSFFVLAAASAVIAWSARNAVNAAYDRMLLDPAIDISENVVFEGGRPRLDLPQKALDSILFDQVDHIAYRVTASDGTLIAGSSSLPAPIGAVGQAVESTVFSDARFGGDPMPLLTYTNAAGIVVQVGETLRKRDRLMWELMVESLIPIVTIALLSSIVVWLGLTRALAPLVSLRNELLTRTPADLRPLPLTQAPSEIAPVVSAFNTLLHRVREKSAAQRRFMTNAAHQLRTPLAGLQMHLELLLQGELGKDVHSQVEGMHAATIRTARTVNQFLSLAKAETATESGMSLIPLDLQAIADDAARQWVPVSILKGIDLGFVLAAARVQGDPLILPELLNNLIDNALRYTPRGGNVTVRTGEVGNHAFVEVDDSGPGIAEPERAKVVERFYRVPDSAGDGSGLGLAIVKEISEYHQAALSIDASPESGGASIRVTFARSVAVPPA